MLLRCYGDADILDSVRSRTASGTTRALKPNTNSDLADFRANPGHDVCDSRHVVASTRDSASAEAHHRTARPTSSSVQEDSWRRRTSPTSSSSGGTTSVG